MQFELQLGQKVWVEKVKAKEESKKRRKGIVKYINNHFIGVWVETFFKLRNRLDRMLFAPRFKNQRSKYLSKGKRF